MAVQPTIAAAAIHSACASSNDTGRTVLAEAAANSNVRASKSAAILGGEMSALERMRMQQTQGPQTVAVTASVADIEPLQPAASGSRYCASVSAAPASATMNFIARPAASDDFLASKRVRIGKTNFDKDWRRVQSEQFSGSSQPLEPTATAASEEFLSAINRWVNRNIRYVEDRELFGQADYWAGAQLTMMLRKGDCEDIALAKMQLLSAAGIPQSDMYLTIARDTVRRADHALLVVKLDDRYVVLDNATDALLDGAKSHDYNPVLSFSGDQAWIHGY